MYLLIITAALTVQLSICDVLDILKCRRPSGNKYSDATVAAAQYYYNMVKAAASDYFQYWLLFLYVLFSNISFFINLFIVWFVKCA